MLGHDSDQFRIRPFRPAEPQIIIGRTAPAQEFTRPYPHLLERSPDFGGAGRILEVFDDIGLKTLGAQRT